MSQEVLSLAPGSLIEKLRIDRVLGQGAFGITYLVTDTVLDKSFALKEYLPRDIVQRMTDGRLQAIDGPEVTISASRFVGNHQAGLVASGSETQLSLSRVVIDDTRPVACNEPGHPNYCPNIDTGAGLVVS